MDPKRHRERRPWTIISAIVWLPKSWRRQGWGFAEKRKNESGFEHELPPDEVLERAERLAKLLTLSYEPMLAWRLDGMAVVCGLAPISVGVRLFSSRCLATAARLSRFNRLAKDNRRLVETVPNRPLR
jgi:hypothetical protein